MEGLLKKQTDDKKTASKDVGISKGKTNIDGAIPGAGKEKDASFQRLYNKDYNFKTDELPIVLLELNDAAISYINKEEYEKALFLLQKAHNLYDAMRNADNLKAVSRRDKMIPFVTFHNMALCYQKLSALEQCSLCLEGALLNVDVALAPLVDSNASISMQFKRMKIECKLHMQTCAILSQLHRHKEALKHARLGAKLAQKLIKKLLPLCSDYRSLVLGEAEEEIIHKLRFPRVESLQDSISLMERNSEKLFPILKELVRRLVPEKPEQAGATVTTNYTMEHASLGARKTKGHKRKKSQPDQINHLSRIDMRNLLGYVNQNEWVSNLNIGNIMQISSLCVNELLTFTHNEVELTRDLILEKISLLVVSYFCVSTEIRFILQLKEDPSYDPVTKLKQSEYWHAKSLEVVCSFLPSDCPLLNHILLSYQKHHSPSQQTIPEEGQAEVGVSVLRPLNGIESQKFQPIIRSIQGLNFYLSPIASPKGCLTEFDVDMEDDDDQGSVHIVNEYDEESLMEVELADSDEMSEEKIPPPAVSRPPRGGSKKKLQESEHGSVNEPRQGQTERNLGSKTASMSKMEVIKQNKSHLGLEDGKGGMMSDGLEEEDSLLENISVVKPATAQQHSKRRNSTGMDERVQAGQAREIVRPVTQQARYADQSKRSLHQAGRSPLQSQMRPSSAKRKSHAGFKINRTPQKTQGNSSFTSGIHKEGNQLNFEKGLQGGGIQFAPVSGIQGMQKKLAAGKKSSSFSRKNNMSLHQYEELKQKLINEYKAQKVLRSHTNAAGLDKSKKTESASRGAAAVAAVNSSNLKSRVPASVASQVIGGGSFLGGGRGVSSASNFINKRNHIAFRVFNQSKSPNPPSRRGQHHSSQQNLEKMNVSVIQANNTNDLLEVENHQVNRSFQNEGKQMLRGKSATPFLAPPKSKEKQKRAGSGDVLNRGLYESKKGKSGASLVGDLNVAMERHFKRGGNNALKFLMN